MAKVFQPFNLNSHIKVRITPAGEKVWREHYARLNLPEKYVPAIQRDSDGWTTMQAWQMMEVFGASMYMGGALTVEMNAMVEMPE